MGVIWSVHHDWYDQYSIIDSKIRITNVVGIIDNTDITGLIDRISIIDTRHDWNDQSGQYDRYVTDYIQYDRCDLYDGNDRGSPASCPFWPS